MAKYKLFYQIESIQSQKTLLLNEKITNEFEGCGTHAYDIQ